VPPPLLPLNALRAFEAIARHLSFAKAADELHVTPAALSHQIRSLEEQLGLELFFRRTRAIELTEAARLIYPGLRSGFESVRHAVGQLERAREANVLVISATPGLVAKWLMPRLWRFLRAHPGIDARVSATLKLADFTADGVDVGIRLSKGIHPELHVEKLFEDSMLPVCSPRLIEQGLRGAADLARFPLIHYDFATSQHTPPTWADWFAAARLDGIDATRGLRVNVADHALDAAVAGGRVAVAQADRLGRRTFRPARDAVRAGTAACSRLLFRLPAGRGDAPQGARVPRLALCRDGGDEGEMGGDERVKIGCVNRAGNAGFRHLST
jgi:LysR family glycine cleavage system transcriptional activator